MLIQKIRFRGILMTAQFTLMAMPLWDVGKETLFLLNWTGVFHMKKLIANLYIVNINEFIRCFHQFNSRLVKIFDAFVLYHYYADKTIKILIAHQGFLIYFFFRRLEQFWSKGKQSRVPTFKGYLDIFWDRIAPRQ